MPPSRTASSSSARRPSTGMWRRSAPTAAGAGKGGEQVRQRQRKPRRRCPPSSPCSVRILRRYPGAQLLLERANPLGGLREFGAEALGLPDLKLVTNTGKRN